MAELADARDSKSRDRKIMRVQLPLSAPVVTYSNFFRLPAKARRATEGAETERMNHLRQKRYLLKTINL